MTSADRAAPLAGARLLVTRERERCEELGRLLGGLGAVVVALPMLEIVPLPSAELDRALASLSSYTRVVFTSAHGVEAVLARLASARDLEGARLAAVGAETCRRLEAAGLRADVVPEHRDSRALLGALSAAGVAGERILLPVSDLADDALARGLRAAGARVDMIHAYANRRPRYEAAEVRAALTPPPHAALFASASAAAALAETLAEARMAAAAAGLPAVTIGPRTTAAALRLGFGVAAEAKSASTAGLISAVAEWWGSRRRFEAWPSP